MKTKVIKINQVNKKEAILEEAGTVVRKGGIVAFPTETVYGLGGDALNPASAFKIYKAKGRPSDNPLIVHIADVEKLDYIVANITKQAVQLMQSFWPGPLTLIFPKSSVVPKETTGGLETVAVRMPNHEDARNFIREAGGYVAAPSANTSGRPSPTLVKYVVEDMYGKVEMILDGGMVGIGLESTIVDLTREIPVILRPGSITIKMLEAVIGDVVYDSSLGLISGEERPKAPGMKYKHYAPQGELSIIQGECIAVRKTINELADTLIQKGERVGVIATDEMVKGYRATSVKSVGSRKNEEAIARRIYQILREFDEENVNYIFSESFKTDNLGQAIMNRLLKAADYRIQNV